MQNVLVIGAGRVGKGLSTELTNKGYSVENYSSKELEANSNLPFSLFDFDTFYWCARESGIPTDISNTGKLFSTLLFEIEKLRWKGLFVFLSSAGEVYGEGLGYPAFENLFSIIRKFLLNKKIYKPDSLHLHHLIFSFFKKTKNFINFLCFINNPFNNTS